METQAGDLLHLLDATQGLQCGFILAALRHLVQYGRLVVHPCADDKREPETLLILIIEPLHAGRFLGSERVQPGRYLLYAGLLRQGAALEVPARQVRVTPKEPLFTCAPTHTKKDFVVSSAMVFTPDILGKSQFKCKKMCT